MRKILKNTKGVLIGTLIVVCLCSCGNETATYMEADTSVTEADNTESETQKDTEAAERVEESVCVYVCGQIQKPGVYTLEAGSRVCDLFELAGGLSPNAATDYWNQARLLTDGEMIYVPSVEEAEERQWERDRTGNVQADDSGKVNINTASKAELMTLPGIGEAKAMAILAYRQEKGQFSSIEELKKVEGIKDGVFSKIKEYIEV